ncbi:predicted protein, partial [Nematostella vectensis]
MVFVFSTVFKAILTRLIFASHAMVAIFWVTLVTKQESLWHLSWILVGLFVETLVCLFYRHGDEYKWVSPSILCYLIAIIPCAWIIELHLLPVRSANVSSILPGVDGEVLTDLIEQTTLLMMILGRWLLPKGSLTRESLSQLLLVNLAMSADIIEFFDILKLKEAQQSHDVTLAILCLWTISLMQFPVNATAKLGTEETAPKHRVTMDLIGTVMALFMQDGPFLTFRLFMIAKYSAFGYMIVFLTVKNALLLTLQVYKLCVMH